ncbi:MAG: hypothetical protein N4A38_03840 [Candidatus Gracilibacteria bacterium]|nr:hypothetical protein [Candidatus Gracilibacteria bacterium]
MKEYKTKVKLSEEIKALLDEINISMGGVTLKDYNDKIKHIIWYFNSYKK